MFLTYQRACGMALRGAHRRRWVKGATAMARANARGGHEPPGPTGVIVADAARAVRTLIRGD